MHRALKIGKVIREVAVSDDPDPKVRRSQNIALAVIAIPKSLFSFPRESTFTPEERYQIVLSEVCRTIVGVADEETMATVKARYEQDEGPLAYLAHQVYRASGQMVCDQCGKLYFKHPKEGRIEGANRLCNGDLVHL